MMNNPAETARLGSSAPGLVSAGESTELTGSALLICLFGRISSELFKNSHSVHHEKSQTVNAGGLFIFGNLFLQIALFVFS